FIPVNDTLRFTYSFASEEYPEYVCTQYNDVFGFFISGPGINGPYENNAENIALIPGTDRPVTINNVNPGVVGAIGGDIVFCSGDDGSLAFSNLYNANFGGSRPVYDGFTDVFVAEAVVEPCQVYTIKLVIADAFDGLLDSGVFLEAKSFGTGSLDVEIQGLAIDGGLAEGCGTGEIVFNLPAPTESDFDVEFAVGGTATPGVDYPPLPTTIIIPEGDSTFSIPISAIEDDLVEGDETILLSVQRDPCNRDTFTIVVKDNRLVKPDLGPDVVTCASDSTQLDGTVDIPLPEPPRFFSTTPVVINQTDVPFTSDIEVFGVLPTELGPDAIKMICIDSLEHEWIDDLDIFLVGPDGQFLELTTDNGLDGGNVLGLDYYIRTCFTVDAVTPINDPGPFAPAEAVPFTGEWQPEGVFSDLWDGDYSTNGTWQLVVTDDTNSAVGVLHSWSICFNPVYQVSYEWSQHGLSCLDCPDPVAAPLIDTEYILTVSDSYGCVERDTINFEVIPSLTMDGLQCGIVTGNSIQVIWPALAGASGYEVSINGGPWEPASGPLEHIVSGLSLSETVEIQVRGLADCPSFPATISCTTLPCNPPTLSAAPTDATCQGTADGNVQITVVSGTGPFTFELEGDINTDGNFTGLVAGSYVATITDGNNCPGSIPFVIGAPESVTAALTADPVSCFGGNDGTASVVASGGSMPYTYLWSNGQTTDTATGFLAGTATVEVRDANGCLATGQIDIGEPTALEVTLSELDPNCFNATDGSITATPSGGTGPYTYLWSDSQVAEMAIDLSAGNYSVTVTDANDCTVEAQIELTEPEELQLSVTTVEQACIGPPNGEATVTVTGGTMPYTYLWEDGQETATANGLVAGMYNVTVTDANDCEAIILADVPAADQVEIVSFTIDNATCAGGQDGVINVTLNGGTPPYTWSGPLNGLQAGAYSLTVTDAEGCFDVLNTTVGDAPELLLSSIATPVGCSGGTNGAIDLTVTGGTPPYTYDWSGTSNDEDLNNLPAGNYTVQVTDANGCVASSTTEVPASTVIEPVATIEQIECNGAASGHISLAVSGGAAPYTFNWSTGTAGPTLSALPAGVYEVTITDAFDCQTTQSFEITQPEALSAEVFTEMVSCFGDRDGLIKIEGSGGTPPYRFRRDNGDWQTNATYIGLPAGGYSLWIQDANGCPQDLGITTITQPDLLEIDLGGNRDIQFGDTIQVFPTVMGGMDIIEYLWTPYDSTWLACETCPRQLVFTDVQRDLFLEVIDENGCTAREGIQIRVSKDFPLAVPTGFTPNGDNINDLLLVHGLPGIEVLQFRVWDRWGELIYEEGGFMVNDPSTGWDGTFRDQNMNGGVYLWQVEALLPDGETTVVSGQATLIR
ncbi:MAG: choice-of-anchor L domain-containing protein, partial [Bacteroidota bacterium]